MFKLLQETLQTKKKKNEWASNQRLIVFNSVYIFYSLSFYILFVISIMEQIKNWRLHV